MDIIAVDKSSAPDAAPLVAEFRVELKGYKGVCAKPDVAAGLSEISEYLDEGFPSYAAVEDGMFVGYVVCRVDEPTVWIESIFVRGDFRRMGIASALLRKAESIAGAYGENTVFNYVHPNNDRMIAFLRRHGYTVLNLIEIRKPYPDEKPVKRIKVGENEFDY
ncbi:MAG: GNAT family N-acetyltransferase [Candidatus Gastranaerophilaceae bacterium]|nr:GNAT family N-acetyltransferase [Christensenellales bacterium]